jgi:hydrogenase maturation protein HypF
MSIAPIAPVLVLGVGNPSRGDDALGPLFVERLGDRLAGEVASGAIELLTDFQLQVEHALDLTGRTRVVFVDASLRAVAPFELSRLAPRCDRSVSTHALSPEAVLAAHRELGDGEPPESWVLGIRGERFELGDPLSAPARAHLDAAIEFFVAEMRPSAGALCGRRFEIQGTVQGVGFRPWVYRMATALGLTGEVRNTPDGVFIEAFGGVSALDALTRAIQSAPPPGAEVRVVRSHAVPPSANGEFHIAASAPGTTRTLSLPPDLATCSDCLREVGDPPDRHHGYVFTSCVSCGPRFAVATALPYDRAATTLSAFVPCPACAREHESPSDRRFHAQTLACPACGPRVWLADRAGSEIEVGDPVEAAVARLCAGEVLAVQGVGAFHLVCDATNAVAVAALRRSKRRDTQPLAVMVASLAAAEAVAEIDDAAREALLSPARPIVLAPARMGALAPAVNGPSRRTGVLLPYTPLHLRLSAGAARPLVVTSGNPSGGPAIIDHDEARARLGPVVNAFLLHDRPIARRVEDSVVAATPLGTRVLRRARGLAPLPIRLARAAPEPVLAVGGHQKNTACIVVGDLAYLTPHLGDLGLAESEVAWRRDLESFQRLLGVEPRVVAHDLHPDYASTRFALARPAARRIGVQHHVAHILAVTAEHRVTEPVIGVAFDGSGWGPDGTSWGAEFLIVDGDRWTRAATFRPVPLPGGEQAIRQVWRVAFAALYDAFGADEARALASRLRAFDAVPDATLAALARMIESGVATVGARGAGRWFDAVGALALGLPRAGFDGHVAVALEEAVEPGAAADAYPIGRPDAIALADDNAASPPPEIDLRPTVRAVVRDLLAGAPAAMVATRFHRTIVDATAAVVATAMAATGLGRVVLAGGSFQNRILERGLTERLGPDRVLIGREVPVNDGGLALGQAWAAVLALEAGAG